MLDATALDLLKGRNYAVITSLLADGRPASHVVWVDADDEHVLVNTETGRKKFENIKRDPRVGVMVLAADNPYRFSEIRGRVVGTITGSEAREQLERLAHKYTGKPYANPIESERVILQIEPERVRSNG